MTIYISWNIDHHSCLAVPQYNKIAVQQGMRAWQLLLDWYTPAERNPVTSCAVALCREVQWVTGKTHNWKKQLATRSNKLHDYKLTIFPLTFERFISYMFRVWGRYPEGASSLHARFFPMTFERYTSLPMMTMMMMMMGLRVYLVALAVRVSHHVPMMMMMMMMMMMVMIIASPGKRWRRTVRLLLLVLVMVVIAIINSRNNRTGQYRYP